MGYDDVKGRFESAGASMRCNEVKKLLESLNFVVVDGKQGNHKVFKHPGIGSFVGGSYNCGHGKNPEVKRGYIKRILRVLEDFEHEIKRSTGEV